MFLRLLPLRIFPRFSNYTKNYILLSLCMILLNKTALRIIKADIFTNGGSYLSFLTVLYIHREEDRERGK